MNDAEKITFKKGLKEFCESVIMKRIELAKLSMRNAQDAANSEEKSSVGDKYETARAMSHLEKDMHAQQLAKHLADLETLQQIQANRVYKEVMPGAFIMCSNFSFFISAGLGKQDVSSAVIYFVSPNAPLMKLIMNRHVGDRFLFNQQEVEILDVF